MDDLLARLEKVTAAAQEEKDGEAEKLMRFADGRSYYGDLVDDVPHGWGELTKAGGRPEYEGEWEHGLFHGKGLISFDNGDTWEGFFRHNLRHGYGVSTPYQESNAKNSRGPRPTFKRKSVQLSPEEEAAKLAKEKKMTPCTTIYWKGRMVCKAEELQDTRVTVLLQKSWRTGTVIQEKLRRDGFSYLHRIRWDDAFEEKLKWWDLSAYQFRLLRVEGKFLHLDSQDYV